MREGYRNVSHRGYTNAVLEFDDCRLNKRQILGEVHKGFEVANSWLGATRLQVAATCIGRAERALRVCVRGGHRRIGLLTAQPQFSKKRAVCGDAGVRCGQQFVTVENGICAGKETQRLCFTGELRASCGEAHLRPRDGYAGARDHAHQVKDIDTAFLRQRSAGHRHE